MRVNIIGGAPGWEKAPCGDISWGFNTQITKLPEISYSVIFDMHDVAVESGLTDLRKWNKSSWRKERRDILTKSLKKCDEKGVVIFSLEDVEGTNCIEYPIDEIRKEFSLGNTHGDYFAGGVAYALALAIYQRFERIDIWGVWVEHGEEYENQKPSIEFWIGVAIGRGIAVHIHGETRLLVTGSGLLYGYNTYQKMVKK